MQILHKLSKWLQHYKLFKEAQQIENLIEQKKSEYDEPWHEEAVNEFGSEPISEEDYAQQYIKTDLPRTNYYGDSQEILDQAGFQTLSSGSAKDSVLGEGANGRVYRGSYKGKPAAAKIIKSRYGLGEVNKWKQILNIAQDFPPELKKHIPQIYLIQEGTHNNEPFELIIMEELKPLNKNLHELLNAYKSSNQENHYSKTMNKLFKDPEFMYELAKNIYKHIQETYLFRYKMEQITPEEILKLLEQNAYEFSDMSRREMADIMPKLFKDKYKLDSDDLLILQSAIFRATDSIFFANSIPMNLEELEQKPMWEMIPETKEYFKMLRLLKDYGIDFDDQSPDNVLLGNDDNLKLIDVGEFNVN